MAITEEEVDDLIYAGECINDTERGAGELDDAVNELKASEEREQ